MRPSLTMNRLIAMRLSMKFAMELGFMDGGNLEDAKYEDYKAALDWVDNQIRKRERKKQKGQTP